MTDLMELASRVEAGESNDRDLNYAILMATGWGRDEGYALNPKGERVTHVPNYLASLDDATSLVPEGWRIWTADFSIEGRFVWMLCGPKLTWITHEDGSREGGDDWYQSGAGTSPERALTAAALRARAHQGTAHVEQ
jgi:hypothetical protein